MVRRGVHFVGSYPAANARTAMRAMIEGSNGEIECVPDGETIECRAWATGEAAALRGERAAVDVAPELDHETLERLPRPSIELGHEVVSDCRSLATLSGSDHVERARHARSVLDGLADEFECPFTLQIGLPHCLDEASSNPPGNSLQPLQPPSLSAMADSLDRRIHATVAAVGADQVLFQVESRCRPREHPRGKPTGPARTAVGEAVAEVINRSTPQARFGVHLCIGDDYNDATASHTDSTAAIVSAIEGITDALERPEALEYVHFPVGVGITPPPTDARAYRQLRHVRELLPKETRIIAGLADERRPLRLQLQVRDLVEEAVREAVTISAPCGLGRSAPEVAVVVMRRMMELASS